VEDKDAGVRGVNDCQFEAVLALKLVPVKVRDRILGPLVQCATIVSIPLD